MNGTCKLTHPMKKFVCGIVGLSLVFGAFYIVLNPNRKSAEKPTDETRDNVVRVDGIGVTVK